MKLLKNLFLSIFALAVCHTVTANVNAKQIDLPVSFGHKDWQLVCDNTRTCRAVGYHEEDIGDNNPVALMLKRQAGANQNIGTDGFKAYVTFGDSFNDNCAAPKFDAQLYINDKYYGFISKESPLESQIAEAFELNDRQLTALVNTLPTASKIELKFGCDVYTVSDKGSTAVLLKMDEVQGRVGTKSAIVKKGNESESKVLPAMPMPNYVFTKIDYKSTQALNVVKADAQLFANLQNVMDPLVLPTLPKDDESTNVYCELITNDNVKSWFGDTKWQFYRLNNNQLVAEHLCWTGMYNQGYGYWLINDTAPYKPQLITTNGVGYAEGMIDASQKGRGVGDCWWNARWQWVDAAKGSMFVKTEDYTTGLCRGIAAGGSFILPTLVTVVVD